jgi:hypothetical protein
VGKKKAKKEKKKYGLGRPGAAERVEVGVSPIHGKGLYARKRIRPGAYVATFEGEPTRKDGMHVLWSLDDEDNPIGVEGKNALRFLNHASNPNAEFIGLDLHALRNIEAGTELTIHYGDDWEHID